MRTSGVCLACCCWMSTSRWYRLKLRCCHEQDLQVVTGWFVHGLTCSWHTLYRKVRRRHQRQKLSWKTYIHLYSLLLKYRIKTKRRKVKEDGGEQREAGQHRLGSHLQGPKFPHCLFVFSLLNLKVQKKCCMLLISFCASSHQNTEILRVVRERNRSHSSRKVGSQHFAFSFKRVAFPTVKNSASFFPFSHRFRFGLHSMLAWGSGQGHGQEMETTWSDYHVTGSIWDTANNFNKFLFGSF